MKKLILSLALVFSISSFLHAQGRVGIDIATEQLYMSSDVSKPIDAYGSPYINENFLPVKVKGFDDQLFTGRYNAYNGEMEINLGTKIIALDNNLSYEVMYTQNNKIYRTYNYITPSGIAKRGFLNVVQQMTDYAVLKQEVVKFYDKVPAATSYQRDKPAKFVESAPNYYFEKGGVVKPVPTKKKDLLKAYPQNAKALKSYLKENKISLKDESDIVKLAGYLATL